MVPKNLQEEISRSRPFESVAEESYLAIVRTAGAVSTAVSRFLKEQGLSEPQYNVLRILTGAGSEGLPCQEIGGRMITPVPDVTRLVDRLEKAGWAERRRTDSDRRVVRVVATTAGKRLARSLRPKLIEIHEQQLAEVSAKDLRSLNKLLASLRESIEHAHA